MENNKSCLIIYIGNGYSENYYSQNMSYLSYSYSVDMRENWENHFENIYQPLTLKGYKIDTLLMTNKHEKYQEFLEKYNSIKINYDDITEEDERILSDYYYNLKVPAAYGPGSFKSGGRFLKLKEPIPEYDLYVFVRADVHLKVSVDDMNIDYNKINYLWPETDINYFINPEEMSKNMGTSDKKVFWNSYNRVNGNVFNVVPKKYFNVFINYIWSEHLAVHLMIKDLSPLVTVDDIHLICGEDECYVADPNVVENPIYVFNKKILEKVS